MTHKKCPAKEIYTVRFVKSSEYLTQDEIDALSEHYTFGDTAHALVRLSDVSRILETLSPEVCNLPEDVMFDLGS